MIEESALKPARDALIEALRNYARALLGDGETYGSHEESTYVFEVAEHLEARGWFPPEEVLMTHWREMIE